MSRSRSQRRRVYQPVPTNQVRPAPPPPPPAKRSDVVRVQRVASCYLYSSFALVCPLCGCNVPPQTEHSCSKLQNV